MILVLVGTNPYSFSRLVRSVDECALASGEEFFVQLGHTDYIPQHAAFERFLEKPRIEEKIRQAELVITQGGFGSIADCLIAGKTVIAVPRKPELNESTDRQEELVLEMEKLGRVIAVFEIEELPRAIQKARNFKPAASTAHRIPSIISEYIRRNS